MIHGITVHSALPFPSLMIKFVQSNFFHTFSGRMTPIQMKDILPDSTEVSKLLEDILGQPGTAEFLAIAVNPVKVMKSSNFTFLLHLS